MPRTKRPVNKPERLLETTEKARSKLSKGKRFDKLVVDQQKRIDDRVASEIRSIELEFKICMKLLNQKQLQMTYGQLKKELHLTVPPSSRNTDKSDDGYMTEGSTHGSGDAAKKRMAPPSSTQSSRQTSRRSRSADSLRRSRSADASSHKTAAPARATMARRRSKSAYRTPSVYKTPAPKTTTLQYPPITPKVAPQTPMMLLRQPRHGEMVVSMQGSPVMVPTYSTHQQDEKVNCGIMLADGTVLSLKPRELRQSQAYIPFSLMEPNHLQQMKTLKENLDKVMKLAEKHGVSK